MTSRVLIVSLLGALLGAANPPNPASQIAPPTTRDLSWLAGHWEGKMTGGPGIADVTFTAPAAGLITGVMRLVDGNKVLVVELIAIVDTPHGPELRFRHFSPALDVYEPTFKQQMRLIRHSRDQDVFENQVPFEKGVMSTQPRVTTFQRLNADSFVGRSDVQTDDGKQSVIEVTYRRVNK